MTTKQIKRLILALVTFFVLLKVLVSLLGSFSQPQVQSNLELYQTNLLLHGAEFSPEQNRDAFGVESTEDLDKIRQAILGTNPYQNAQQQYEKIRQETKTTTVNLQTQLQQIIAIELDSPEESVITSIAQTSRNQQQVLLQQQISEAQNYLDDIDIRIGILQAQQGDTQAALDTWNRLSQLAQKDEFRQKASQVAGILSSLWDESPLRYSDSEAQAQLETYLDAKSWFRYRVLVQLYEKQGLQTKLVQLQNLQKSK